MLTNYFHSLVVIIKAALSIGFSNRCNGLCYCWLAVDGVEWLADGAVAWLADVVAKSLALREWRGSLTAVVRDDAVLSSNSEGTFSFIILRGGDSSSVI